VHSTKSADEVWQQISAFVIPYTGGASQIFVLDLPGPVVGPLVDRLKNELSGCSIATLDGYTFGDQLPAKENEEKLSKIGSVSGFSTLVGSLADIALVQIWFWPNAGSNRFDIEIVFFAEEFFSNDAGAPANLASFQLIYNLAELVRADSPDSDCVFSDNETADPRSEKDRQLVW
jgi:hypothetical protein